jgi:hypothetical protein
VADGRKLPAKRVKQLNASEKRKQKLQNRLHHFLHCILSISTLSAIGPHPYSAPLPELHPMPSKTASLQPRYGALSR